eukprot:356542-Chlamydomonas_euryale.AAC.9
MRPPFALPTRAAARQRPKILGVNNNGPQSPTTQALFPLPALLPRTAPHLRAPHRPTPARPAPPHTCAPCTAPHLRAQLVVVRDDRLNVQAVEGAGRRAAQQQP